MPTPHILSATYRITTPMFIGDAEQKASGVAPASVKGALRFWWRALNWGRIKNGSKDDAAALRMLHKEEGDLFGSVGTTVNNRQVGGQGRFILRVIQQNNPKWNSIPQNSSGIKYLLGQGLYHFRNGLLREAILGDIRVECVLQSKISDEQINQLCNALLALGMLGGLGSRSRKGFGSLSIRSLQSSGKDVVIPKNKTEYGSLLQKWGKEFSTNKELPPFTAFSKHSRIDLSAHDKDMMNLLNKAGSEQQLYRSWGRNGKVGNRNAEQNFKDDHDLLLKVAQGAQPALLPQRAVFGLPHNYHFSSGANVEIASKTESGSRRASPLFIHIHTFPDGSAVLIQSLLPATFLPSSAEVEFKGKKKSSVKINEKSVDWQVIHAYLDRFQGKEKIL